MIVTEVHLLESLVYRGIGNFPKNKACGTHLISYRSQLDLLSSPPPAPECGEYDLKSAHFEKALEEYNHDRYPSIHLAYGRTYALAELSSDPTIQSHLASLCDNLLEQNILRIIEPYSVVEIEHAAELVG
ncbi:hypothetical protein D9611_013035 [Ephemerocybe angulata]|uniref:PCI domain-containing protein n=1 Tax=Ephemerocybe angulata TaxID=980116 RepID=A0A8H5ETA6_9AGAR|nr:hypothetical protein D9611_013035 [Tulosesus angulatus]